VVLIISEFRDSARNVKRRFQSIDFAISPAHVAIPKEFFNFTVENDSSSLTEDYRFDSSKVSSHNDSKIETKVKNGMFECSKKAEGFIIESTIRYVICIVVNTSEHAYFTQPSDNSEHVLAAT
jgi:hypothetical protein